MRAAGPRALRCAPTRTPLLPPPRAAAPSPARRTRLTGMTPLSPGDAAATSLRRGDSSVAHVFGGLGKLFGGADLAEKTRAKYQVSGGECV